MRHPKSRSGIEREGGMERRKGQKGEGRREKEGGRDGRRDRRREGETEGGRVMTNGRRKSTEKTVVTLKTTTPLPSWI